MIMKLLKDNQLFKINIEKNILKDLVMFIIVKISLDLILLKNIFKLILMNLNQLLLKTKKLLDQLLKEPINTLSNIIWIFQLKIKDLLPLQQMLDMMFLFIIINTFLFNKKHVILVVDVILRLLLVTTPTCMVMEKRKERNLGNKKKNFMNGLMFLRNLNKDMERILLTLVYWMTEEVIKKFTQLMN